MRHIDEILAEVGPAKDDEEEETEEGWEDVQSSGDEDDGKMDETWLMLRSALAFFGQRHSPDVSQINPWHTWLTAEVD